MGGSVGKVNSGNPYMYANNVPVMQTDPSGRNALDLFDQCLLGGGTPINRFAEALAFVASAAALLTAFLGAEIVAAFFVGMAVTAAAIAIGACIG